MLCAPSRALATLSLCAPSPPSPSPADYKPWLVEVNTSLSLATDAPLDKKIKNQVVTELLHMLRIQVALLAVVWLCKERIAQGQSGEKGRARRVEQGLWRDSDRGKPCQCYDRKKLEERLERDKNSRLHGVKGSKKVRLRPVQACFFCRAAHTHVRSHTCPPLHD
jgi:hypothetical protein